MHAYNKSDDDADSNVGIAGIRRPTFSAVVTVICGGLFVGALCWWANGYTARYEYQHLHVADHVAAFVGFLIGALTWAAVCVRWPAIFNYLGPMSLGAGAGAVVVLILAAVAGMLFNPKMPFLTGAGGSQSLLDKAGGGIIIYGFFAMGLPAGALLGMVIGVVVAAKRRRAKRT